MYRAKEDGRNRACCYWEGEVLPVTQVLRPPSDEAEADESTESAEATDARPEVADAAEAAVPADDPPLLPSTQDAG